MSVVPSPVSAASSINLASSSLVRRLFHHLLMIGPTSFGFQAASIGGIPSLWRRVAGLDGVEVIPRSREIVLLGGTLRLHASVMLGPTRNDSRT